MAGCVLLCGTVTAALAGVVYARSRSLAHGALEDELRFRAGTLSGMLETAGGGIEFEVPEDMLPDFDRRGTGAFMEVTGPSGKVVVRSPSLELEGGTLPPPAPWTPGGESFAAIDGPGGLPCVSIQRSFLSRTDASDPVPEEARRHRIVVALDRTGRDRALADLAWFLAGAWLASVLAALLGSLLLSRRVLDPVRRMTEEASGLTPEDAGRRLRPGTMVRELHRLAVTLNSALDRLGEALGRQRRFASDASHELRTPISVLMANAEHLLRRPRSPAEYREGIARQLRTARQMRDLAENLLLLARTDGEGAGMARDPLRLDEVAAAAAGEFEDLAAERGVALEVAAGLPVTVVGDPVHLRRLVANLVSNALKFTPPGGRVGVATGLEGEEATLTVRDTGTGIPPEDVGRIFDRFYRVGDTSQAAEGAGLGLAIVDGIVRAHGGRIEVESRPGEGLLFRVRLPAAPAADAPAPPRPVAV